MQHCWHKTGSHRSTVSIVSPNHWQWMALDLTWMLKCKNSIAPNAWHDICIPRCIWRVVGWSSWSFCVTRPACWCCIMWTLHTSHLLHLLSSVSRTHYNWYDFWSRLIQLCSTCISFLPTVLIDVIHFTHLVRDYSAEPEFVQLQRLVPSNIPLFLFGTASPLIFLTVIPYAHLDAI